MCIRASDLFTMGAGERVLDDIALMAAIHEAQIVVAVVFDGQFT